MGYPWVIIINCISCNLYNYNIEHIDSYELANAKSCDNVFGFYLKYITCICVIITFYMYDVFN